MMNKLYVALVLYGNTTLRFRPLFNLQLYVALVLHGNTTDVQDAYGCYHCMWYEYYTEIQPGTSLYGMKTQQYLYNNNNIKKKLTV